MKKGIFGVVLALFVLSLSFSGRVWAEDSAAAVAADNAAEQAEAVVTEETPVVQETTSVATTEMAVAPAPAVVEVPAEAVAPAETPAPATENLEFVSGEVTAVDVNASTMTLKLYGDVEDGSADKVITVNVDSSTDVTDGEKDRTLGSIEAGTEVDVEYDPATSKATYVFIY